MTRSRTATSVSSAASLSATAVTTSTTSALPAAAASACASALRPDWAKPSTAPWRSAPNSPPAAPAAAGFLACPNPASPWVAAYAPAAKAFVGIVAAPRLDAQDLERARDHPAGRGNEVEVGFIAALGLAHVHRLDDRVHVRELDLALRVGGRMAGLVFGAEGGRIGLTRPSSTTCVSSSRSKRLPKVGILRR